MSGPGEAALHDLWLMAKTKGPFQKRLIHPLDLPVLRKVSGPAIMIATDAQNWQIGCETPIFNPFLHPSGQGLRAMQKIAKD